MAHISSSIHINDRPRWWFTTGVAGRSMRTWIVFAFCLVCWWLLAGASQMLVAQEKVAAATAASQDDTSPDKTSPDKTSQDKTSQNAGEASGGENQAVSATQLEFFEKQVRPIFVEHCYECHDERADGGLHVNSRAGLLRGGDTGAAVVPGDPDSSLLVEAIRYENQDFQMPPQGRLKQDQIDVMVKWIEMGAPDPRLEITGAPSPIGMSIQDGRKFWSFQPVINPSVPDLGEQDFVKNPIDAFILQKLMSCGLQPAPPAEAGTLARRLYMNVTGVPPTPEQLDRFLSDGSPGSTQKLIDRLLHSPAYGERWGRHWLDVARYADSNGLDENLAFGNAWRYRDYVIGAFNDDRAFNRFLMEQLAGDLLPDSTVDQRVATAFHRQTMTNSEGGTDDEEFRVAAVVDRVDALGWLTVKRIGRQLPRAPQPAAISNDDSWAMEQETMLDLEPIRELLSVLQQLPGFTPDLVLKRLPRLVREPDARRMGAQMAKGLAERGVVRLVKVAAGIPA